MGDGSSVITSSIAEPGERILSCGPYVTQDKYPFWGKIKRTAAVVDKFMCVFYDWFLW